MLHLQRQISLVIVIACFVASYATAGTSLDTYVAKPDETFTFDLVSTTVRESYTIYDLTMTSQTWRHETEVSNHTEWEHLMRIVRPDAIQHDVALLQIGGLNNGRKPPADIQTAVETGTIVVHLPQVPNQPLRLINGEGRFDSRVEDGILARTFRHFLDGGDDEWPALLPMVKSAVRAMDTTQQFMAERGVNIDEFVVTGHSKRGWTTWLTAAVDDRVVGIAPQAIDLLNIDEQAAHHRRVYEDVRDNICGGFSCVIKDYVREGVVDELDTPRGQELLQIVDPFEYRDRLDMPKYIINATGDEFFPPDSSQFYFDELAGTNYLRYIPNTNHGGMLGPAKDDLLGFYSAVLTGAELPEFTWTVENAGATIRVQPDDSPTQVKLWQAHNPDSADFRLDGRGAEPRWRPTLLETHLNGDFVATVDRPATGATAFMVELVFDVNGNELPFTTNVSVIHAPELLGDCAVDGLLDAADLACVITIPQRDAVLGALDTLPGDLDGNGDVSFGDFLQLSANFGQDLQAYTSGNIDLNGEVAFADFLTLSQNLGNTPGLAAAVPEPSAALPCWLVAAGLLVRRRVR